MCAPQRERSQNQTSYVCLVARAHAYAHAHTRTLTCTLICTCVHTRVQTHTHMHTHTHTHTHTHRRALSYPHSTTMPASSSWHSHYGQRAALAQKSTHAPLFAPPTAHSHRVEPCSLIVGLLLLGVLALASLVHGGW